MNVTVLGCGEAFDDLLPNTSLLVRSSASTMLLDCGFTVPPEVWKHAPDANSVDLIYISHAHADHYFGLPGLLGRMWEEGRTKPLVILTQPAVIEAIEQVLALGYRSLRKRFLFPLRFEAARADGFEHHGASFRFAATKHSSPNLAVRIEADRRTICYSGDGAATPESCALCEGADLLIHEAFSFDKSDVHATVDEVLELASAAQVQRVALVHISRRVRRERTALMKRVLDSSVRGLVPSPGDAIAIPT